jgi:hypothetical protein
LHRDQLWAGLVIACLAALIAGAELLKIAAKKTAILVRLAGDVVGAVMTTLLPYRWSQRYDRVIMFLEPSPKSRNLCGIVFVLCFMLCCAGMCMYQSISR